MDPATPSRWRRPLRAVALGVALGLVVAYPFAFELSPLELLRQARPEVILTGVLAYWLYMLLRSWRLQLLLGEEAPALRDLFHLQCVCGALGALTPARVGEAAKVELLRRQHQVPLGQGMLAFGVEKTQDMGFYALAGLASLLILGVRSESVAGLRVWVIPGAAVLLGLAAVLLALHMWRRSASLAHVGRILLAGGLVFAAIFGTCYVVFMWHRQWDPLTALAIYALTTLAGVLSALPGGQGVVQFAFHGAAVGLFDLDPAVTASMVLHLTINFYLGVASSVLLSRALRTRRGGASVSS